jgi:hypothetical protein
MAWSFIDTVVCLTLAKWETVSGRFGGYLNWSQQGCLQSGHPITGSIGAPGSKPLAVKLMMSVIVAARAGAKETLNAVAHNTPESAALIFNFMSVPPLDRTQSHSEQWLGPPGQAGSRPKAPPPTRWLVRGGQNRERDPDKRSSGADQVRPSA